MVSYYIIIHYVHMFLMGFFNTGTTANQVFDTAGFNADHVADLAEMETGLGTFDVGYFLVGGLLH